MLIDERVQLSLRNYIHASPNPKAAGQDEAGSRPLQAVTLNRVEPPHNWPAAPGARH